MGLTGFLDIYLPYNISRCPLAAGPPVGFALARPSVRFTRLGKGVRTSEGGRLRVLDKSSEALQPVATLNQYLKVTILNVKAFLEALVLAHGLLTSFHQVTPPF